MTTAARLKQVLAVLKGAEATLRAYATKSSQEEEQAVFNEAGESVNNIVKDLEARTGQLEMEEPQF